MVMLEKWDEALARLEPRRAELRSVLGDDHGLTRGYFWVLHQSYEGAGRPDEAEAALRESLEACHRRTRCRAYANSSGDRQISGTS